MTGTLATLLGSVNDWLKFAEAKNAALIAFCSVTIPAYVQHLNSAGGASQAYCFLAVFFLAAGLLLSLFSVLPMIRLLARADGHGTSKEPNLYYFSDIGMMSAEEFRVRMGDRCAERGWEFDGDAVDQIHANSVIASRKFRYFDAALRLVLVGLFTPVFAIVFLLMAKNDEVQ